MRAAPGMPRQAGKAALAALAARSISSALPCATRASGFRSIGEIVSKVSPAPPRHGFAADVVQHAVLAEAGEIAFGAFQVRGQARHFHSSLGWRRRRPCIALVFQLSAGSISRISNERAKCGSLEQVVEMLRKGGIDRLAGLPFVFRRAPCPHTQRNVQKSVLGVAVGNSISTALDSADPNRANLEDSGLQSGGENHIGNGLNVGAAGQIGRVFHGEMGHDILVNLGYLIC